MGLGAGTGKLVGRDAATAPGSSTASAGLAADEWGQVPLSREKLLQLDPDILVLPGWVYGNPQGASAFFSQVTGDPSLKGLRAVKAGRVYQMPERLKSTTSQYIVDGGGVARPHGLPRAVPIGGGGMLILVTGGSRSGKSSFALRARAETREGPRTYIATAQAFDDEMRERIAAHRRSRPAGWALVEEPLRVPEALAAALPAAHTVVLDCVTMWMSNLLLADERFDEAGGGSARAGACRGERPRGTGHGRDRRHERSGLRRRTGDGAGQAVPRLRRPGQRGDRARGRRSAT